MRGLSATVALAACLLAAGCGAKSADEAAIDAKGILVFSGLPSPPFLHSIRPDGSDLRGVALPKTCGLQLLTRDGRTLVCFDLSDDRDLDHWEYAVGREGDQWRRVPMPREVRFPEWSDPMVGDADAPEWAPARDMIALIRPNGDGQGWFSATGDVAVAVSDGSNQRVLAQDGEVPSWSPDGTRVAFARCLVSEYEHLSDYFAPRSAKCSLWTVAVEGKEPPELLVVRADSPPVWSPDGRYIAFLRHSAPCDTYCRFRIAIVSSNGGEPQEVGPELIRPNDCHPDWCPDFVWLPDAAPVIVPDDEPGADELQLQRCVDIWNRVRMYAWPTGAVNVSLVGDRCQVTVSDYGALCEQSVEMPFRYWCPSHGAGLHQLPPEYRVWNGHGAQDGKISLFDPPEGPRLALPKAPSFPMLDGYVIPFGKDGEPLPDLRVTQEVAGTCDRTAEPGSYPLALPDGYPERCWWRGSGSQSCFKSPGRLAIGDVVFCPQAFWHEAYDPMQFVKVKVAAFT